MLKPSKWQKCLPFKPSWLLMVEFSLRNMWLINPLHYLSFSTWGGSLTNPSVALEILSLACWKASRTLETLLNKVAELKRSINRLCLVFFIPCLHLLMSQKSVFLCALIMGGRIYDVKIWRQTSNFASEVIFWCTGWLMCNYMTVHWSPTVSSAFWWNYLNPYSDNIEHTSLFLNNSL